LRVYFIGLEIMLLPDGVSPFYKPEYGVAVYIVFEREAVLQQYFFKGCYVRPSRFFFTRAIDRQRL
jgi:hypothetical protein